MPTLISTERSRGELSYLDVLCFMPKEKRPPNVGIPLDEQLLDLVLERQDLTLELRGLVGGDRARDDRARHAARTPEGHLQQSQNQSHAVTQVLM